MKYEKPWLTEPDHIKFIYKELPCIINRNSVGSLCGYVGIPKTHPLYGKTWESLEDKEINDIIVHGGITYAEDRCFKGIGITPKEYDGMWWLGFDCSHYADICPKMDDPDSEERFEEKLKYASYKTVAFVENEIKNMVNQLIEMD